MGNNHGEPARPKDHCHCRHIESASDDLLTGWRNSFLDRIAGHDNSDELPMPGAFASLGESHSPSFPYCRGDYRCNIGFARDTLVIRTLSTLPSLVRLVSISGPCCGFQTHHLSGGELLYAYHRQTTSLSSSVYGSVRL